MYYKLANVKIWDGVNWILAKNPFYESTMSNIIETSSVSVFTDPNEYLIEYLQLDVLVPTISDGVVVSFPV